MSEENRRLYLVHWHNAEAEHMAMELRQLDWRVAVNANPDDVNLKMIRQQPPKAVIISLCYHTLRGREIAETLWWTKWGKYLPIIFLACPLDEEEEFHADFPHAIFTDWDTLPVVLNGLPSK